jgi:hypothetical protein
MTQLEGATTEVQCVCKPGRVQLSGQGICGCEVGYRTNGDGGCQLCDESSFSDEPGSSICTPCPAGSKSKQAGASDAAQCVCGDTFVDSTMYGNLLPLSETTKCASCMGGGQGIQLMNLSGAAVGLGAAVVCPGTLADGRLFTAAGHWRGSLKSVNLYKCEQESHCNGAGTNCTLAKLTN